MAARRSHTDEAELHRAQEAAKECERAARQLVAFTERMSTVVEPADLVEFDELIAREATAQSRRVEAFGRLGLGVGSIGASPSVQ